MPLYIERETESKMVERARIQSQASKAQICVICQSTGCRLRLHFYDVPSFLQFLHEPTKFWETLPCSKGTSILKGYGFEEEEGNVWTHTTTETSQLCAA